MLFDLIKEDKTIEVQTMLEQDPSLAKSKNEQGISCLLQALYMKKHTSAQIIARALDQFDWFEAAAMGDVQQVASLLGEQEINAFACDGFTALHLACFFDQPAVVEMLINAGANPNIEATNGSQLKPINSAAATGAFHAVHYLLTHKADPNARQAGGYTPLMSAAASGNKELIELLLKAGADPNLLSDKGESAADLARNHHHAEVIPLLATKAG